MLKICRIHRGDHRVPIRKGESVTKPKLRIEAEVTRQLDRIAPDWPLHLYDSGVIDHILKVINTPRTSRTDIPRRYRVCRIASDLVFRGAPFQLGRRR